MFELLIHEVFFYVEVLVETPIEAATLLRHHTSKSIEAHVLVTAFLICLLGGRSGIPVFQHSRLVTKAKGLKTAVFVKVDRHHVLVIVVIFLGVLTSFRLKINYSLFGFSNDRLEQLVIVKHLILFLL